MEHEIKDKNMEDNQKDDNRAKLIDKMSELKNRFLREEISAEEYTDLNNDLEKQLEILEEKKEHVQEPQKGLEEVKEEKEFRHKTLGKTKKKTSWMYASIIIGALFVLSLFSGGFGSISNVSGAVISSEEAAKQAVDFINNNLLQGDSTATLEGVSEEGNIYKVTINIDGKIFDSYTTKDGKYLFPQGINLDEVPEIEPIPKSQPSPPSTDGKLDVSVDDDPSLGTEDAPVVIVEFSDFQCPFCAKVVPTVKEILKEYDGKVRLVFRDFPLSFHSNAQKAAEAAECADEQGKFWEYHDTLFENQQSLDVDSLKRYAKDIGLDSSKFDSCLDSGRYESEVQKDLQDGSGYGVSGTPAFFINGRELSGAQPFSAFQQIIEEELAK